MFAFLRPGSTVACLSTVYDLKSTSVLSGFDRDWTLIMLFPTRKPVVTLVSTSEVRSVRSSGSDSDTRGH